MSSHDCTLANGEFVHRGASAGAVPMHVLEPLANQSIIDDSCVCSLNSLSLGSSQLCTRSTNGDSRLPFSLFSNLNQFAYSQNAICRRIPNLNPQQVDLCQRNPDIVSIVLEGVQLALAQCERYFHSRQRVHHTWNCSSWINPNNGLFLEIADSDVIGMNG